MTILRNPDGLARLIDNCRERARAFSEAEMPALILPGDLTRWRRWAAEGGEGFFDPDDPAGGFYRTRLVSNGPWVPAAIWQEPEGDWWGWIDDELWPLDGRLMYPRMIREGRWLAMHEQRLAAMARGDWHHFTLRPRTPLDMTTIPAREPGA